MKETKGIYGAVAIITIFTLAGFFLVFNSLGALRSDIENINLALHFKEQNTKGEVTTTTTTTSPIITQEITNTPKEKTDSGIEIPTAIMFESSSSPALLPQSTITVTIESVIKYADGTVAVNFRAFTNKASGYTSFDPRSVIQILNLDGNNQTASTTTGKFDSIPPKSASSGILNFNSLAGRNTLIFQIGSGETIKFYEFDFLKKLYQETAVG